MQALSITTFFNGISTAYFAFNAVLLLRRKQRSRLQTILGVAFAYWAVMTVKDLVSLMPGAYTDTMLDAIVMLDGYSLVPITAILFEVTMPGWASAKRLGLLSLPFAAFLAIYAIAPTHRVAIVYMAFLAVFGGTVVRICYARLEAYTSFLHNNFSDLDGIDISWLKKIYFVMYLYMLLWVIISLVREPVLDSLYYLLSVALWQSMLHYCSKMKDARPCPTDDEACCATPADTRCYPFAGQMEDIVEEDAIYLDPSLTLDTLARRLGTNRTYLSNYFNNVKGVTFYDYINALRIQKKSIPMMNEHPEYALEYVARESGFNSISTFRRAFRKHTGTTPGQYPGETAEPKAAE